MACPICGVCASCKWSCGCWLRASQVKIITQLFRKSNIQKTNIEAKVYIIDSLKAKMGYSQIKEWLKLMWFVFTDDYSIERSNQLESVTLHHPVYDWWCFKTLEEGKNKLGKKSVNCEFLWLWAWERCIYCNSLQFYKKNKPCLAITGNMCEV